MVEPIPPALSDIGCASVGPGERLHISCLGVGASFRAAGLSRVWLTFSMGNTLDMGNPLGIIINYIEWASARVPPTPLLGGWAEGGWSISNPVTSQILARNLVPFDSAGSKLSDPWTLQPLQPCQLIVLRRRIGLSLIFPIQ